MYVGMCLKIPYMTMGPHVSHTKNSTDTDLNSNHVASLFNCFFVCQRHYSCFSLVPEALSLQSLFVDGSKSIPGAKKFKNIDEMTAVVLQRRLETVSTSRYMRSCYWMLVWAITIYLISRFFSLPRIKYI